MSKTERTKLPEVIAFVLQFISNASRIVTLCRILWSSDFDKKISSIEK